MSVDLDYRTTVAVIGAGPAGLMAAETLAQQGHAVRVFDRKPSVARKLLMAGRGGLNITHSEPFEKFVRRYGPAADILRPALERFTPDDLREWCEGLGQETFVGTSGRVFPTAMKASPLLRAWLRRLEELGVTIHTGQTWKGWAEDGALLFVTTQGVTERVQAHRTLLALGGASWPDLGSDGAWMDILSAQGVDLSPLRPANCGFHVRWSDYFASKFAGHPLKNVALAFDGLTITGEMMISATGIEGGAVYALSSRLRVSLERGADTRLMIDLKPSLSPNAVAQKLDSGPRRASFTAWLRKALNLTPAGIALMHEADPDIRTRNPAIIANTVKHVEIPLDTTYPIARAISSAGGIRFAAVTPDYALKRRPDVFVAGEMLDWEAPTGGYLLQACMSTGRAAAFGLHTSIAQER